MPGFIKDEFGENIHEGDMIVYEGQIYQVHSIISPNITDPTIKNPQVPIVAVRLVKDITVAFNTHGKCKNVYKCSVTTPARKAAMESEGTRPS